MFSFNLAKLLACCKVLPSSSIILSSPCADHQKMPEGHTLDLLLDGPEPIFRCNSCGDSLCAASYMMRKLGFGQEQVYENLLMSEVSITEANSWIYRASKYLRLMSVLSEGRKLYRDRLEADDRRNKKYGDWAELPGSLLNELFFRKSIIKVSPKSNYALLTLRDENGIPSIGYIYTLMGSFVGEVQYPISCGNIHSVAERWTDFVSWQGKIVATQDPALAQLLSKSMSDNNGKFDYPIVMPFSSKNSAKYFSRLKPKISLVLADNEEAGLCASFHTDKSPVEVFKLPGTVQMGFGFTGKIDEELQRIKPQKLVQNIIGTLINSNRASITELIRLISRAGHGSSDLIEDLIKEYCDTTKQDIKDVTSAVKSSTAGLLDFCIEGKTFKVSHGKYFQRQPDLNYSCISNFWIDIEHIISDGKKDIDYLLTLYIGTKSKSFYVSQKTFSSSTKLMRKIVNVALLNGLDCPQWNSTKGVQALFPQIVRGLCGNNIPFHKKEKYGFVGGQFSTDKYLCNQNGVKIRDGYVGEVFSELKHPNHLHDLPKYRSVCKDVIQSLCETEFGAACFVCATELICHIHSRGRAHLVVPRNIAAGVSSILGLSAQEEFLSTDMIQYVDKNINHKTLLKHNATISLIDVGSPPNKRCIYFKDNIKDELLLFSDTLLLFLCELVFVLGVPKTLKHIESILQKRSRIANFRLMRKKIGGVDHTINEFIESIHDHQNLKEFVDFYEDSTFIDIKIFRSLKCLGYNFNKNDVIQKIRQKNKEVKYPHIIRGGTHRTGILIKTPNIFSQLNDNTKWKMRHLSLQ